MTALPHTGPPDLDTWIDDLLLGGESLTVAQVHERAYAQFWDMGFAPPSRVDVGLALDRCRRKGLCEVTDWSRSTCVRQWKAVER